MQDDIVMRASAYARAAHGSINQRRKYSDEPYIVHPEAVARTVASVTEDVAVIAAAWLHDVVEDTPITIDQIVEEFGDDVATLVLEVTNVSRKEDGNRARRKEIDRLHVAKAQPRAKTIKLADVIDNLSDIENAGPSFADKYVREKERQLEVLIEGNDQLFHRAQELVKQLKSQLPLQTRDRP